MKRRGFTIIELIIVIAIMGILLVLAVVNLRGTQVNARDEQRKANVEAIAQNLEVFYRSGTDGSTAVGEYPPTTLIGIETDILRDLDTKSLISPNYSTSAFVAATNATETAIGVTPSPDVTPGTDDRYIYQPMKTNDGGATWTLCTSSVDECRRFNLYYFDETDAAVVKVESRNR
jgi:prepilin-type N-terminal cleavage/methylation domain-containing protein